MDRLDAAIISILQRDGGVTNVAIAEETGVSEETIRRRRRQLIEGDYLRIIGITNPDKLGFDVQTLIALRVDSSKVDSVADTLANFDEISWVIISAGSVDVFAWTVIRSMADLRALLRHRIAPIDGVQRTEVHVSMATVKGRYGTR